MKRNLLILFFLIYSYITFGQILQVGQKAPDISIQQWIKPYNPIKLTNKSLLIDFWATWCAPCIEGFPHLDSLNKKYGDKINFLAMTTDKAETVQKFLKRMPLNTAVVIDRNGQTNKNFQIEFIPTAILIDTNGTIQWIGSTRTLTEKAILEFLQTGMINDSATVKRKNWQDETKQPNEEVTPFHKFIITDAVSNKGFIGMTGKERSAFIMIKDKALPDIIQHFSYKTKPYFNFKSDKKNIYLNIEYRSKIQNTEDALPIITQQLLALYQLQLEKSTIEKDAWIAEVTDTVLLNKKETVLTSKTSSQTMFKNEDKTFYSRGGSIKVLLENMENKFGIPIFIKKEPAWTYDFELPCSSFDEFKTACLNELGITFKPIKKKITVITIKDK